MTKTTINHMITIAKSHHAVGLEKIEAHPCVTKAFDAPCGFIFFEFYHDLLFRCWNHQIGEEELERGSELKKEVDRLGYEQNDLLAPLHSEVQLSGRAKIVTGFGFHINDVFYFYRTDRVVRSPVVKRMVFTPGKRDIVLMTELRSRKNPGRGVYERTLKEWQDWCRNSGREISMGGIGFGEDGSSELGVCIRRDTEDSLAVLIMMLHERKGRIGLNSIDIFGK